MPPPPSIPVPPATFDKLLQAIQVTAALAERSNAATDRHSDAEEDSAVALREIRPLLRELLDWREADVAARILAAKEEGRHIGIEEGMARAQRAVEDERRRQIADLLDGGVSVVKRYAGGKVGGWILVVLAALAGWFGVDVMAEKAGNPVGVGDADSSGQ